MSAASINLNHKGFGKKLTGLIRYLLPTRQLENVSSGGFTGFHTGVNNMEQQNQSETGSEVVATKRRRQGQVIDQNGNALLLDGSLERATKYVAEFLALPDGPKKGYDTFWSRKTGYTNPRSIATAKPQGVGKMMLVLQHVAAMHIAAGGDEGAEMAAILSAVSQYSTVAQQEAAKQAEILVKQAEDAKTAEAVATIVKAKGVDEATARQVLATLGIGLPLGDSQPSPTPEAVTEAVPAPTEAVTEAPAPKKGKGKGKKHEAAEIEPEPQVEEVA